MNILVIGNGFDVAHGLPTKYEHFLKFVNTFVEYKKAMEEHLEFNWEEDEDICYFKYFIELFNRRDNISTERLLKELETLITDNVWLNYFNKIYEARKIEGKDGWIDFESEISDIVQQFDSIRKDMLANLKDEKEETYLGVYRIEKLTDFFIDGEEPETLEGIEEIKKSMLADLNKLTRCLEIYLSDFISQKCKETIIRLPDIQDLQVDKVLSFNYTDTYARLYNPDKTRDIDYDFIHGQAKLTNNTENCNLVLGIDEYLKGTEKDEANEFVRFKKFFQRIYKGTGCKYKRWIKDCKETVIDVYDPRKSYPDIHIYIYGHSLADTDKDILRDLILTFGASTTIFHHSKDALGDQIANLVKVIGEDTLIEKTGGIIKTITFKETRKEKI